VPSAAICCTRSVKRKQYSLVCWYIGTSVEQLPTRHPCRVRIQAKSCAGDLQTHNRTLILPHLPQIAEWSARKCVGTAYKLAGRPQTLGKSRPGKGQESRRAVMQLCRGAGSSATSNQRQPVIQSTACKVQVHASLSPPATNPAHTRQGGTHPHSRRRHEGLQAACRLAY
jgi:hypothetical protein